ncbi:uncharacterized protein DS421_16g537080 [Arachis hypogaea]|nr:uncharacterized protein DS421_16g537080 [Arachis hypogaea]
MLPPNSIRTLGFYENLPVGTTLPSAQSLGPTSPQLPPVPKFSEPSEYLEPGASRKHKNPSNKYGSVFNAGFDAIGFNGEYIMPRSPISLDNANMEKNLEIKMLVKGASELLESARPSTKTLPNSLWCSSNQSGGTSCQDFEFEKEKSKWEVKRNTMKSEATRLKEMVKQANADCEKVLAAKEKAKESHTQVFGCYSIINPNMVVIDGQIVLILKNPELDVPKASFSASTSTDNDSKSTEDKASPES